MIPALLTVFAFAAPLSIAASTVALLALILAGVVRTVSGKTDFRLRPLTGWEWALVLFFVISLVSGLCGTDVHRSLRGLLSDYTVLLCVIFSSFLDSERSFLNVIRAFLAGTVLSALIGMGQWAAVFQDWESRAAGTRSNVLTYAESLMFGLALVIPFCGWNGRPWKNPWNWLFVLFSAALLATKSRGPWLAVLLTLAVTEAVRKRSLPWRTMLAVAAIVILALSVHTSLSDRFRSIADTRHDVANRYRLYIWSVGIPLALERPWLGYGSRNVKKNFEAMEKKMGVAEPQAWGEMHNQYLQFVVERGALALTAFLAFVALLLKRHWRYRHDPWVLGFGLGVIAFLFAGLTESIYNDSEVAMLFYTFCGLMVWRARALDSL